MTSITTRPARVCFLLVRCLKLTALFQSSPPPLQGETDVPPLSPQQGETQWTFSGPTRFLPKEKTPRTGQGSRTPTRPVHRQQA
jgi:hypothetical protein